VRISHPAAPAKHRRDVGCSLARAIAQVQKAEPQRDDALDRVGVVSALIAPLLISRMRSGPVEFRANPVFLVEVIEVLVTGTPPDSRLPTGRREPVRAFNPANIAVFEQ